MTAHHSRLEANVIHRVLLVGMILGACGDNRSSESVDGGMKRPDAMTDGTFDAQLDGDVTGFTVGGNATGVRGTVVLTLTTGTDTRHVALNADGPFAFPGVVAAGSDVVITTTNNCDLLGATVTNLSADVSTVEAFCEGVVQLSSVAFASGTPAVPFTSTLAPTFDPAAYAYAGTRPFFMDDTDMLSLTPAAAYPNLPSITVYTDAVTSGQPSPAHAVGTQAPVRLQHGATLDRTYQFTLLPGTPAETAFVKASPPVFQDVWGSAVALSGNVLVVGSPVHGGTGVAYVMRRGSTGWSQEQIVTPTSVAGAKAGTSVAIDGDVFVVGANMAGSGTAYVYRYAALSSTWVLDGTLTPTSTVGDGCGTSVAISGSRIIIGCPAEKGSGNKAAVGAVYMYRYDTPTSAWVADGTVKGANTQDQLGAAVAISGTTALAAAPLEENGTATDAGGVHVLVRGASSWSQQGTTLRGDAITGAHFGMAVAISGDYAVVGAPDASTSFAFIFQRVGTTWSVDGSKLEPTLLTVEQARFGQSVAIDGIHAVIGAPLQDGGIVDSGVAHAYRRESNGWTSSRVVGASNAANLSRFGASVAVDGEWFVVGSTNESTTLANSGAVYVFR